MEYSSTDIINNNVILFVVIIVAMKMMCNFLILIYLLHQLFFHPEIVLRLEIFRIIYTCAPQGDNISLADNSNINQSITIIKNNYRYRFLMERK